VCFCVVPCNETKKGKEVEIKNMPLQLEMETALQPRRTGLECTTLVIETEIAELADEMRKEAKQHVAATLALCERWTDV
jgi:hypothetical protein